MNAPAWWAQPSAPEGASDAEGIRKQLGRPNLDPLQVLVREAAQNTWDARLGTGEVGFDLALARPGETGLAPWVDALLPVFGDDTSLGLAAVLHDPDTVLLTVSDRGTGGLGGPLRGDRVHHGSTDFVGLVRDIGRTNRRAHSGGTYGFGKGVLFTTSAAGTVLVRTRCRWQDRVQTRLIAAALGTGFDHAERRYTGRHWWGRIAADNIPDPLLDEDADAVADALGLPARAGDELGTDIVIVGARLGSSAPVEADEPERPRTIEEAAQFLGSAMLWELWPVMIDNAPGAARMRCRVSVDDRPLDLPDPDRVPRLQPFIRAHRSAHTDERHVRSRNPAIDLGRFALEAFMTPVRPHWTDVAAPSEGPMHHCALMRQAGLVVHYRPGPQLPDSDVSYGAVFRTAVGVDDAFAAAEPPTHDAWVPKNMPDPDARKLVRSALRTIDNRMRQYALAEPERASVAGPQPPLGALSHRFASLVPTGTGEGADSSPPAPGRRGGGGTGSLLRTLAPPRLVEVDGAFYVITDITLASAAAPIRVLAMASVALDHGSENDPPAGAIGPEVVGFRSPDAAEMRAGDVLTLTPADRRDWVVVVRPVAGAATRVRVSAHLVQEGAR
ncbi:hypothetical protein PV749_23605 [Streptomyces sp. ID03-2B]|uniref:hypothetical protein n=1 Tax=Streptomyces sp. ID03-2B TaxID=3028660 RepID=UPI0029AB2D92|nr:hypothetical protein [Streptomyces sp. ID03-2B]MDX3594109.1 hypothetical protein [Streptomyces sp. ID03-2B]